MLDRLKGQYRFIAVQMPIDHVPGRGKNDFRDIGQLTDFVLEIFEDLDLDKAIICGNSLGGQVALDFYLKHPQMVSHLILTGSAGLFERSLSGGKRPKVCRKMIREQITEIFYDEANVTEELIDSVYNMLSDRGFSRFLLRIAIATRNLNMEEQLKDVTIPTLIVWGADDKITPPFVAEQFHEGIGNSELKFIERCGHAPPMEQPEEFTRIVGEFLNRVREEAELDRQQVDTDTTVGEVASYPVQEETELS